MDRTLVTQFDTDGFFIVRQLASLDVCEAMKRRVVDMVATAAAGEPIGDAYVVEEASLKHKPLAADRLSKLFRVHRAEPVFREFAERDDVLDLVAPLVGNDIDCFLSQFIFKLPGALGQPWHQDRFYFNFDRGPQVGVWLAITEAHADNGPLWVLPGSHKEPVHKAIKDEREGANPHYFEIVDHDMAGAVCVLMQPGDALFFHSHLMHKSTDNLSRDRRAAMVYHYGAAGTIDRNIEKFGKTAPNIDWIPVRRNAHVTQA